MNKYPVWKKNGHPIHRDVAEKLYGRKIDKGEVVHHIDGNTQHWEKCNLIIMKKEDHEILSLYMKENKKFHYPKFKHWIKNNKKADN